MARGVPIVKITVDGVEVDAKACTKCGEVKALVEFTKNRTKPGGRESWCKECRSVTSKMLREASRRPKEKLYVEVDGYCCEAKKCSMCGELSKLSDYHVNKTGKVPKYASRCKSCTSKVQRMKNEEKAMREGRKIKNSPAKITSEVIDGKVIQSKSCHKCRNTKELSEFYEIKEGGYYCYCKSCCREQRNVAIRQRAILEGREFRTRSKPAAIIVLKEGVQAKSCQDCGLVKPLDDFYTHSTGTGGRLPYCRVCKYRRGLKEYEANKQGYIRRSKRSGHRRRANMKHLPCEWSEIEESSVLRSFHHKCALTNSDETLGIDMDHVIPLSIGHGGTYVGNVIPLGQSINRSKNAGNIFDWFEANRQRFELDQSRFDSLVAKLAEQNGLTSEEFREYTDWCFANPRDLTQIKRDNARYGYRVTSVELWREATGRLRTESVS